MAGENIDNLLVGLGLNVDKQSFDNGVSQIGSLRSSALGLSAAAGAAAAGTLALSSNVAQSSRDMGNFAQQMNVSVESLNGLEYAFERVGGSASDARGAVEKMTSFRDALLKNDTQAYDVMSQLGLDPRAITQADNSIQALKRTMSSMEGMGTQRRRALLQEMGMGDPSTFQLFSQGRESLDRQMQRGQDLNPINQETVDESREFTRVIAKANQALEGVAVMIANETLPEMTKFANWFSGFVEKYGDLVPDIANGFQEQGDKAIQDADWLPDWMKDTLTAKVSEFIPDSVPLIGGNEDTSGSGDAGSAESSKNMMDRVLPALAQVESRGRHRDANGNLTRSPDGALGKYQIMPNTGRDPGYGVQPLQNNSMDEQRRFAKEYLDALQEEFGGSLNKALAAYNAGPGAVKNAVDERGGNWMQGMPQETQNYVPSIRDEMRQGREPVGPGNAVQQSVEININGNDDPQTLALEIDRRLRDHSERAANDYRSPVR